MAAEIMIRASGLDSPEDAALIEQLGALTFGPNAVEVLLRVALMERVEAADGEAVKRLVACALARHEAVA
jgi:hypothetical protein